MKVNCAKCNGKLRMADEYWTLPEGRLPIYKCEKCGKERLSAQTIEEMEAE